MTTIKTLPYTWTVDEIRRLDRLSIPVARLVVLGTSPAALLIGGIAARLWSLDNRLFGAALLCYWPLILAELVLFLLAVRSFRRDRRRFLHQPQMAMERWHEIDAEFCVTYLADGTFSRFRWAAVDGRVRRDTHSYTFDSSAVSLVIPLRTFASEDDQHRFEAILAAKGLRVTRKS